MRAELIDYMGSDLTCVNAARVSFDKESEWGWEVGSSKDFAGRVLRESDAKLIRYLARHEHYTPFTHCTITLRETVPIFVARQRFKHVVGFSYNEISRRYVDTQPEFYTPDVWREKAENKKQGSGSGTVEKFGDHGFESRAYQAVTDAYEILINHASGLYSDMLHTGISPEQARMVLPQSMMTSYYVTGSLAAWARAYKLRIAEDSQKEIQELAKQWDDIIAPLYPQSWKELANHGSS